MKLLDMNSEIGFAATSDRAELTLEDRLVGD